MRSGDGANVYIFQPFNDRALSGPLWEMAIWHNRAEPCKVCVIHTWLVTSKVSEHKFSPVLRRGQQEVLLQGNAALTD